MALRECLVFSAGAALFRAMVPGRLVNWEEKPVCAGCAVDMDNRGEVKVDVRPGDTLVMKKTHPCGGKEFIVLRSGMDFKIRCMSCGHEIMVPRLKCEKNIRKILRGGEEVRL